MQNAASAQCSRALAAARASLSALAKEISSKFCTECNHPDLELTETSVLIEFAM
jgi:hypothetical protein